ncbi:12657_t:CDS:2 [Dentiscutata heterogama]|uniref:12657_t:CDS:1 n=1 Tax=Dentiscutata heterogama TaxID=1316150 RepID=A0ACA9LY23_9GLOM|nr:12657_t:CDS:2 [Dentiscutata heterogama]
MNPPNNDNDKLLSHRAFSVSLILINILAHILLEREIVKCTLVNRWWNQLATERLWYRFRGLKNNSKTKSFEKFLNTLVSARDGKCLHQYGNYVKILDLEKLELDHEQLLMTLECCQRIETFIIGSTVLNKQRMYDMASRLPNLKFFKFSDSVEINDGEAMDAIAEYCPRLEELELKKDISCFGEVLFRIVQKCKKIQRLDIEEKNYEDQTMIPILEQVPEITQLKIHQCIGISEEVLLKIFKFCPKLTKLNVTNMHEITAGFALETAKHFKKCSRITVNKVDRPLDSSIEASEDKLNVSLYEDEVDLGMIINYFINRKEKLRELILSDVQLNKLTLGIISENLDLYTLILSGVKGLAKADVLTTISKLKNLKTFSIRFSTIPTEYMLKDEKEKLFEICPNLEFIQWHTIHFKRN